MKNADFIQTDAGPVARAAIRFIDTAGLEETGSVVIHHAGGAGTASGFFAFEALMLTKPSAMEGKKLRYRRGAWIRHNLVSHPLMQIIALAAMTLRPVAPLTAKKFYEAAIAVHEATVPAPTGIKLARQNVRGRNHIGVS